MFRFIIAVLLVCASAALPAKAENMPQRSVGFEGLLEKLKQHPEIASYESKATSLQHYAEGELGLPDPMLFVQQQDFPIGASTSQMQEERMIGFKQEIPLFGIRETKSEKMKTEAHKTKLTGEYAFVTMKAKLIAVLANWQSIKEQQKLLDEQGKLFASEKSSITGRIAADQSNVSQLSASQADSTEIDIMRAELMEQEHEVQAMLMNMVGEAPDIEPPPVAVVVWDHDPDKTYPVKIAAEDITIADKEVDIRDAEFNPRLEVQASYGQMNNGDNAGSIMLGVTIPLWSAQSQAPRLEGAKAALYSSKLDQNNMRRGVIQKLDHLKAQIDTSEQKIALLQTKNTQLEAAASALTREYEAGKADLAAILKSRRDALSVRLTLAQERAKRIALIADFNHYVIGDAS